MKNKLLLFLFLAAVAAGGALIIRSAMSADIPLLQHDEAILSSAKEIAQTGVDLAIALVTKPIRLLTVAALLLLLGVLGILFIRQRWRAGQLGKPAADQETLKKNMAPAGSAAAGSVPALVGVREVEAFFLELYRRQLGARRESRGLITSVEDKINPSGRIYNLSVKHKGSWVSRHMTIRPLGEVTHSKSQCFQVIYDTHMVLKIPPAPIKDFSDYIRRIQHESSLVDKLAPLICIIPNTSVILSRLRKLVGVEAVPAISSEETYIRFLKAAPEYRTCLKIGGAFAFFMDLSRHFFLTDVLAELHDVEVEIKKTIASDAAVMLHGFDFETKYGPQNVQTCLDLQAMYGCFESKLTTCLIQPDEQLTLSDKQKREWFFGHIAGETLSPTPSPKISDAFMDEVKRFLKEIPSESTVKAYQKVVRDHAGQLLFYQNRPQFEEMVTNLLSLLVFLEEKRVCLRDLKPDNLLVAGKTENYPLFLLSADDYSIGLIDLETAVQFGSSEHPPPAQPHLAGTPAYATPSHFAMNDLLMETYDNLPWILQLQDWHAMVGIIYEVVTGCRLFLRTGRQIPGAIRILQQARTDQRELKEVYLALNGAFWKSARAEFTLRTKAYESRLDTVMVRVPAGMKRRFETYLLTQPGKKNFPLLSERPGAFSFTLSAKHLLERMFEIVADTMDNKDLSDRNADKKVKDAFWECEGSENMTCSIGYTLSVEIPGESPTGERRAGN